MTKGGPVSVAQSVCPVCGAMPRPQARFCDGCGTALHTAAGAGASAEYKQVTVLFADVTHSMDIAAAVGPERLREIMSQFFELSSALVQRAGGTVDKFIGDGLMALFGAPIAMEDHALRACYAALTIQEQARRLAAELAERDAIDFRIRVGLNSGEVIAGEIGYGPANYTVIGEQVGLAQRMESAAPPGGVMLSESTARLVEDAAVLGPPELVAIKGAPDPVPARRLLAVTDRHRPVQREPGLVGRGTELHTVAHLLDTAVTGRGCVLGVVGPPGIGKSRLLRETAALATDRGMTVCWTFCQPHTREVPWRAAAGLLREFFAVADLDAAAARGRIRSLLPETDSTDVHLLDDLLGIADPESAPSDLGPDARRRRLSAILDTALVNRREPTLYIIEDAHWIDHVSESMFAEFAARIGDTPAVIVVAHRPEYQGALHHIAARRIDLAPLDTPDARLLTTDLLGTDPSVARLVERITDHAAGNPFFTEEIVRDLAERGVLVGARGAYRCQSEAADVTVPATVQATIAARLDRLSPAGKRTLSAAAVIGSPFATDLLATVAGATGLAELEDAELISRVGDSAHEFTFRHPLMRAVAYGAQLKSVRAQLHRRIADAIETMDPRSADNNAAVIATHLEAGGELRMAFEWHMRAGGWATHRNIAAARMSWQRAAAVADSLPADDPDRPALRIAPRTLLCATAWRVGGALSDVGFEELRELTESAGDKRSLAIGMSGQVQTLNFHGEYRQAARMASEHVALLDAIGDRELTVGLLLLPTMAKWNAGEMVEALRLAERTVELAAGEATLGNLITGSPLALVLALRASCKCCLGLPDWRSDFDRALSTARAVDEFSYCAVVMFKYITVMNWVLLPDDDALRDTEEALRIAREFGDDFLLTNAEFAYAAVLVRRMDTDRRLGFELLANASRLALEHRYTIIAVMCEQLDLAAEAIRLGDYDTAVERCRGVLADELRTGEGINRGWSTSVLVEALLARGHTGDLDAAQHAVDALAAMPADPGNLYHELPLLRLNALIAAARGDDERYREFRDRYRDRSARAGFAGHIALAGSMV